MSGQDKRGRRLKLLDDPIGQHLRASDASGELRAPSSWGKPLGFGDGCGQTPACCRARSR